MTVNKNGDYIPPIVTLIGAESKDLYFSYEMGKSFTVAYKNTIEAIVNAQSQVTHPTGFYWKGGEFEHLAFDGQLAAGIHKQVPTGKSLTTMGRNLIMMCLPKQSKVSADDGVGDATLTPQKVTLTIGNGESEWFYQAGYVVSAKLTFGPPYDEEGYPMIMDFSFSFLLNMGDDQDNLPSNQNPRIWKSGDNG